MVLTSFKPLDEVGLEDWIPSTFLWSNYAEVFSTQGIQFGRWYWNSTFVAAWVTLLQVFTSSLAAFSFSRLKWPGRDKVFLLYLATMMLPGLVMMIPNYQIMIKLRLVDTYLSRWTEFYSQMAAWVLFSKKRKEIPSAWHLYN